METAGKPFAAGKRSLVYLEGKVIVKKVNPKSNAINRINNEAHWLSILNRHKIGPKLLHASENEIRLEFIEGTRIIDWIKENKKPCIRQVLIKILKQCRELDKLHVNKYELTNPYKHIIIRNNKPVMIDFERCRYAEKPKNVTQFCQFLISKKISSLLLERGIVFGNSKLQSYLKDYKTNPKMFASILRFLSN